jgi:uncharacterized delta-60 repeat protein
MRTARRRSGWKRYLPVFTVCVALAAAAAGTWLLAAPGDLDPTFGSAGQVLTDVPVPFCCEEGNAIAIQPDGRIVIAGSVFDSSNTQAADNDFALARYTPDGQLDASFGNGGLVVTKFFTNSSDQAKSIAIQSDGKIVVAGVTQTGGTSYMAIARYLPNGQLDTTFHSDGKADLEFGNRSSEAWAVAIQSDGRIVVAGRAWDNFTGDSDFALSRLNADGSLDLDFGVFGSTTTPFLDQADLSDPFQQPYDVAQALLLQPDGKIVAAGYSNLWPDFFGDMAIVRYTTTGAIDTGFGTAGTGKVRIDFNGIHDEVTGAALQPDGGIVLGGFARNAVGGLRWEFALARLDANGIPDPAFDDDGRVTTRIDPFDAQGTDLGLQADGRIVVAGNHGNNVALARYRTNGALDTSFSSDGIATTDLGGLEAVSALAIQADGKIVTTGRALPLSGGGNFSRFLLLRYDGGGGMLEQTIDFPPLPDRTFGDPPFDVSAIATSGLPVTFSAAGACSISGSSVTITGSGSCSITASQDGNATYAPAPDVTRTFQVLNARTLTIMLTGTGSGHVGSSPDGIDCGSDCSETYQDGATITLVPTASAGSSFVVFDGDADCADGTVTMSTNVACTATFDRTATTTTVSSSLNPSTFSAPVTFTVVVAGSGPTGTVTVRDGAMTLATGLALSAGSASVTLSTLTTGTHTITAQYSGDTSNAGSTSAPLTQVVDKAMPMVTLTSSRNPSSPGEAVTLSGTVPPNATGTVTILDGALSLGNATISAGGYALTMTSLSTGSHTLKARYNGDGNYLTAESAALVQVIETGNRAPQITPIPDQNVTWGSLLSIPVFATDADNDPLTFSLVTAPAGASISSSGQFTWTPTSEQVGSVAITVQVSDSQSTTTGSFNVAVGRRATTISYLGPGAASAGPVELSARLTDATQNTPVAGRTITFQIGTQSTIGTTDATGLATATIVLNQPVGNVSVNTSFAGDTAYESSSSTLSFRIDAPPGISPIAPQSIPWGQMLSFVVDASDPEGAALTFTLLSAPAGVGLNFESPTRRRVVWTPTQAQIGLTSIVIGVSDGVTTVSVTVAVEVLRQTSAITQVGPGASGLGPVTLTATLREAASGVPLAGRTVTFALGGQVAGAPTNALGVASASLNIAQSPQTVPLVVSFAGDPLYAPTQASQPFLIYSDVDGDGLRDEWEINGVDIDGNGSIDLNLPAMGANPHRKDVFIEVDWMVKPTACVWLVCWSNGGVLQPQRPVLDELIARFRMAPVINPDGSAGISVHIDGGPDTVMNPLTGEPWGPHSRAGVVPYDQFLGTADGVNYDWSEFEAIKQAFMEPARRAVFHYVVYADILGGVNASGISRGIPAADFILAAGDPSWNGGLTVTQERSLFLHELGHNLALHHGGADDINYKPNYHSVLNYLWSLTGLPPDNRPDYSNILETAIDEAVAGDVNGDGRVDTLLGHDDWPNLVFTGGGLGDLAPLPPPTITPVDPIDPNELRARKVYARAGDGLLEFKGPSLLAANSGVQSLAVDVKNISDTDASYAVSLASAMLAAPLTGTTSVPAGGMLRVMLNVDTTGLVPGEYIVHFTLRSAEGDLVHQRRAQIVVVDLTLPENQQAARDAIAALSALPADSGLDAAIKDQVVTMLGAAAVSWTAAVTVTGRAAFDAVYAIAEPDVQRPPGPITARSLSGSALFELSLLRAGKVASGSVRMQQPDGSFFEAPIAGSWNESTRVFEGKWLQGKRAGGSIVISLREPLDSLRSLGAGPDFR